MVKNIVMPKVSDVMENGTVTTWLKKEGEKIQKGEPLLEIEVEKAIIAREILKRVF